MRKKKPEKSVTSTASETSPGISGILGDSLGGSSTPLWGQMRCRHPATPVFTLDEVCYYGGSEWLVQDAFFDGLAICLLGKEPSALLIAEKEWQDVLAPCMRVSQYVSIDWPDYGVPPVLPTFWPALHAGLRERKLSRALFYCAGGHGRTGTALAAVLVAVAGYKHDDAIAFVREHYCTNAVEGPAQVDYLRSLER